MEERKAPKSESGAPSATPHSASRLKVLVRRSDPHLHAPSTLPPPPFESETEVPGLEWWLDAHMALAADLLCLSQTLDVVPVARATHADAVRQLSIHVGDVRDALYELYCDAAHPRTSELPGFLAALEPHVRQGYAWCGAVVALLVRVAAQLRAEGALDWDAAKLAHRAAVQKLPHSALGLRDAVRGFDIDFTSPVEPLRNLTANLDQLAAAVAALDDALAKRFG